MILAVVLCSYSKTQTDCERKITFQAIIFLIIMETIYDFIDQPL